MGAYLNAQMSEALADHPNVGEVRGEGMLCAVELVEDRDPRKYFDPSRKIGMKVIAELATQHIIGRAMPGGDILGFAPPFCLTKDEADRIVDGVAKAIRGAGL